MNARNTRDRKHCLNCSILLSPRNAGGCPPGNDGPVTDALPVRTGRTKTPFAARIGAMVDAGGCPPGEDGPVNDALLVRTGRTKTLLAALIGAMTDAGHSPSPIAKVFTMHSRGANRLGWDSQALKEGPP